MVRPGFCVAVATAAILWAGGASAQAPHAPGRPPSGPSPSGPPPSGPWQTCDVSALVRAGDVLSLQCDSGSEPKRIVRLIGDDDVLASATSMALASKTQKLRLQYRATPVPEAQAARCRAAGVARPCHTLSDVGLDFPDKD